MIAQSDLNPKKELAEGDVLYSKTVSGSLQKHKVTKITDIHAIVDTCIYLPKRADYMSTIDGYIVINKTTRQPLLLETDRLNNIFENQQLRLEALSSIAQLANMNLSSEEYKEIILFVKLYQ